MPPRPRDWSDPLPAPYRMVVAKFPIGGAVVDGKWVTNYIKQECRFHCFGTDYDELEGGPGNHLVALVETSDGKVIVVPADDIRFTTGLMDTEAPDDD